MKTMTKSEKYTELIRVLEKVNFLTSDSFQTPDRTYIYLDYKYLKPIRFMGIGDISYEFNIDIYKDSEFREVKKLYNNDSYLNDEH